MTFVLAIFALIVLCSIKRAPSDPAAALSVGHTQALKGVFVITIFFSHFCSYITFNKWIDTPMQTYCHWLGQLMVAPFFFYSGYGIFESVQKKGPHYIKNFPTKRILKTLLHFDLAVLLFLLYDLFLAPERLSATGILLSLFAWESIGNFNWFIFAIICVYLFSFLGLLIFKGDRFKSLIFTTIFCLIYMIIVSKLKDSYWVDTILAFPLGSSISLWKDKIIPYINKKWAILSIISLMFLIAAQKHLFPNYLLCTQLALFSFSMLILLLSMRAILENKILSWCGLYVFDIYILQRLPMNFGKYFHWNEQNPYLYFIFCFATTILIAIIFHKTTKLIDSKLFKES